MPLPEISFSSVRATSLADFTTEEMMIPRLRGSATAGIIHELSHVICRSGVVSDTLPFYQRALNREFLASSALPCGIALPHARTNSVRELRFAVGKLSGPTNWCGQLGWPIEFVFLLAVPATDAATYLEVLRAFSTLGSTKHLLEDFREAATTGEMLRALGGVPLSV